MVSKLGTEMLEFLEPVLHSPWQCRGCLGILGVDLCNKSCFDVYEAGNDHGFRVYKLKPMIG